MRLNELDARWVDAARARRARLRFVTDPAAITYELRALAAAAENEGDLDAAIADVQRALAVDATDPTLVETLDRLLSAAGQARAAHRDVAAGGRAHRGRRRCAPVRSQRAARDLRRGRAGPRTRSATCARRGSRRPATPGCSTRSRACSRPSLSDAGDAGARALVELYAQAAEQASDAGRKAAYLEKVALLWEELLGDPARAARAYEQVLAIDEDRRSAILGLQRTAARSGRHARRWRARSSTRRG